MATGNSAGDPREEGINPTFAPKDYYDDDASAAQFKDQVAESFYQWKLLLEAAFPKLTINFVNLGDETGISVPVTYLEADYALPHKDNIGDFRFCMHRIDSRNGILAYTYSPGGDPGKTGNGLNDLHFDVGEDWRVDGVADSDSLSIKYVAAHELGHALGLGHDTNPAALMYSTSGYDINFSTSFPSGLAASAPDLAAVKALFYAPDTPVIPAGAYGKADIVKGGFTLSNDCGPCCECQDFINVYEAIRRLTDRYNELGLRAEAIRDQYALNKSRWEAEDTCRHASRIKIVAQPLPYDRRNGVCRVAFAVGLCNGSDLPLNDVELRICFDYGPDDNGLKARSTIAGCLACGTTYMKGNSKPVKPKPGAPALYNMDGAWPRFSAIFDCINPGTIGSVSFIMLFPGCTDSDSVQLVARAFGLSTADAEPVGDGVGLYTIDNLLCCDFHSSNIGIPIEQTLEKCGIEIAPDDPPLPETP